MTDYTFNNDFSVKDALPVDDPNKLILGADLDAEFEELATVSATKYDSGDIATQVQAEAGTSNSVLMTPLRVAQYMADSGGGGAGIVNDLIALADPGADRILFWDDSVGAAAYLTVSTGLTLSGTNLTANAGAVDHDSLQNYDANDHVDHTTVTLTLTEGLQWSVGGTDISASATGKLDLSGLTAWSGVFDLTADKVVVYDASATEHKAVDVGDLVGIALGDGNWYRTSSAQSMSTTEATLVFNASTYDALERGAFSTSTGQYTAHATEASRIRIDVQVYAEAVGEEQQINVQIQNEGADVAIARFEGNGSSGPVDATVNCGTTISLAAGDVVRVRVDTGSGTCDAALGATKTYISIVELA